METMKPNFFCGECPHNLAYGEVDAVTDQKILAECSKCTAWRTKSGINLYTSKNVFQCWHCINHVAKFDDILSENGEMIAYPFCGRYQEIIKSIPGSSTRCIDWSNAID